MGYVQKHLQGDESIVHLNNLHWIIFGWPVFWLTQAVLLGATVEGAGVIASVIFLFALLSILFRWISLKTSEFAVTEKRIILKTGLIRRRSVEMNLAQVEGVTIDQGAIGRMLNFGTVAVRGTGLSTHTFAWISHPMEFKQAVQEQSQGMHAREIGRHVEALQNAVGGVPTPLVTGVPDTIDRLEKLAKLRTEGVLTEEEFRTQKAKLLK